MTKTIAVVLVSVLATPSTSVLAQAVDGGQRAPIVQAMAIPQVQVETVEELRPALAPKDLVSIVQTSGDVVAGQLVRFGNIDLEVRAATPASTGQSRRFQTLMIPHGAIRSIERLPDSSKNGALIGAGIGAGMTLAMFLHAFAVDRNEMDEWASGYLLAGGLYTGLGALVGWAIDHAKSKPRIRFDVRPAAEAGVPVAPSPETLAPPLRVPLPRPLEPKPEPGRAVVSADIAWLGHADQFYRQQGVPLLERRNVGTSFTTRGLAVAYAKRNMSIQGEVTWVSPSSVTLAGLSLCSEAQPHSTVGGPTFSADACSSLSDWPAQTANNQRVASYTLETRMRPNASVLFGVHLPGWKQTRLAFLIGTTISQQRTAYREQQYAVTEPGVVVLMPTYTVVGRPYEDTALKTWASLTLGVDARIGVLSPHFAVVPNVRLGLGLASTARVGASLQWTP
jgi:hypothetical protein